MKQETKHKNNAHKSNICLLGAHFSIAGGLERALYEAKECGCTALQIFTKNASTWKERTISSGEIERFQAAISETGITHIAAHTSYLINIASPERKKRAMSCKALEQELVRSSALGIPVIVLHPGSHMNAGVSRGIDRIAAGINDIFSSLHDVNTRLLLETTAGQGASLGHTFEQLAAMIERIDNKDKIGFCLDTSHIFAAGYDIRNCNTYQRTFTAFDQIIGLEHLYLLHLNDSKKDLGSRVDRHEHIGLGFIGPNAFEYIMNDDRLADIPKIIETPKNKDGCNWDRRNLERLRSLIHQG